MDKGEELLKACQITKLFFKELNQLVDDTTTLLIDDKHVNNVDWKFTYLESEMKEWKSKKEMGDLINEIIGNKRFYWSYHKINPIEGQSEAVMFEITFKDQTLKQLDIPEPVLVAIKGEFKSNWFTESSYGRTIYPEAENLLVDTISLKNVKKENIIDITKTSGNILKLRAVTCPLFKITTIEEMNNLIVIPLLREDKTS